MLSTFEDNGEQKVGSKAITFAHNNNYIQHS
jgi:hypothetical protein